MISRIVNFYALRAKGVRLRQALDTAGIDWMNCLCYIVLLILLLGAVDLIDRWAEDKAEERAAPHRAQAEENLRAFNHAMNGKSFVIENEWRALFTCKAQEMKL